MTSLFEPVDVALQPRLAAVPPQLMPMPQCVGIKRQRDYPPPPPTCLDVSTSASAGGNEVPGEHRAVRHCYKALSALVSSLHVKVPHLRFDADLAAQCANILSAATSDCRDAAALGQTVTAAQFRPHIAAAEEDRAELDRLTQLLREQEEQLAGYRDMAQCLESVCHATSRSRKSNADAPLDCSPESTPERHSRQSDGTPDTPPWFANALDLPFALPSVPEIRLDDDEQSEADAVELGDLLVKDLKFHGFDAICQRYLDRSGQVSCPARSARVHKGMKQHIPGTRACTASAHAARAESPRPNLGVPCTCV